MIEIVYIMWRGPLRGKKRVRQINYSMARDTYFIGIWGNNFKSITFSLTKVTIAWEFAVKLLSEPQ